MITTDAEGFNFTGEGSVVCLMLVNNRLLKDLSSIAHYDNKEIVDKINELQNLLVADRPRLIELAKQYSPKENDQM